MFLCNRQEFESFVDDSKSLQMARFYKQQRLKLDILLTPDRQPQGGQWVLTLITARNCQRCAAASVVQAFENKHLAEVISLVAEVFVDHPGQAKDFWWPTTRAGALAWLDDFLQQRLAQFGPFEDAISQRSDTLFHSALSPLMNIGLLTPKEVVAAALERAKTDDVPLASLEGFVRQIIGWREFIRGVYQNFSERQQQANFWQHERQLTDSWYQGNTGIPPLTRNPNSAKAWLESPHSRLMVVANLMTLARFNQGCASMVYGNVRRCQPLGMDLTFMAWVCSATGHFAPSHISVDPITY